MPELCSDIQSALRDAPGTTFIRAADALHLACAAHHGFTEAYSIDRISSPPLFGCFINPLLTGEFGTVIPR